MGVHTKVFEVKLQDDKKALAFDLRANTVDWLRTKIAQKIRSAEDAGVDKKTAIQRFCLTYAGAAKASRLARAVPAGLVRWAAYVEHSQPLEWFPFPDAGTVGTFDVSTIQVITNDITMIQMGGLTFAGVLPGGLPEDLVEVRVTSSVDGYKATLVYGKPDDGSSIGEPEPVEGELQPA